MMSNLLSDGVRFQCQGSGKCCISHGEYGFVYLSLADRRRLASQFQISTAAFTRKYCKKKDGFWILRDVANNPDCVFLENKKHCSVYNARPTQCRTWPFWPEVMSAKSWRRDVVKFCPGIGKGKLYSYTDIMKIAELQSANEKSLLAERSKK